MTARRRSAAAGLALVAGTAFGAVPATAEPLGLGWSGEVTDPELVDGAEVVGTELVVPVRFEYRGTPGSTVVAVTLGLEPVGGSCPAREVTQPLATGDGAGRPVLSPRLEPAVAEWTFALDPGCNGVYDLSVRATADPRGPAEPGDPGTESEPLRIDGVALSLAPLPPEAVAADVGADRAVTVRWRAPAAWADGPPRDAGGYRVERAAGVGEFLPVGTAGPEETSHVDRDLVHAPAGTYRYRVVAVRAGASGQPVESRPATTTAEVGAEVPAAASEGPPAPVSPATTAGGGPPPAPRPAPPPATPVPAPEFDAGYRETLDYGVELGAADAVPPGDGAFLDVDHDDDEPLRAGILVPAAVASCMAVWALHARHLVRRATPTA